MVASSFTSRSGVSSSNWPTAARTKKLPSTDWQMSIESNTAASRASTRRKRMIRRTVGSYWRTSSAAAS